VGIRDRGLHVRLREGTIRERPRAQPSRYPSSSALGQKVSAPPRRRGWENCFGPRAQGQRQRAAFKVCSHFLVPRH
jgi:hypothetical protein